MNDKIFEEVHSLKAMAEKETNPGIRMSIYEAMASYGSAATGLLLELAQWETDEDAKRCALAKIVEANSLKS